MYPNDLTMNGRKQRACRWEHRKFLHCIGEYDLPAPGKYAYRFLRISSYYPIQVTGPGVYQQQQTLASKLVCPPDETP